MVVEQTLGSLVDIHLLLIPMTYAQYEQQANQPGSGLLQLDVHHGSRPDAAECL